MWPAATPPWPWRPHRTALLKESEKDLLEIREAMENGHLNKCSVIGGKVHGALHLYKTGKFFQVQVSDCSFRRDEAAIAREAAMAYYMEWEMRTLPTPLQNEAFRLLKIAH